MSSKIASIILAAGESKRFGENKFLTKIDDVFLIERTLEAFINHQELQNDIIVVTGHYTNELEPILIKNKVKQQHNPSFNLGMSLSIKCGLAILRENLDDYSGILIHLGDIPFITHQDLDRLISCHKAHLDKIIIPKFNSKRGHPIIIPKILFPELDLISEETKGLSGLIRSSDSVIKYVNVNNQGVIEDIDTKNDLEELSHLI